MYRRNNDKPYFLKDHIIITVFVCKNKNKARRKRRKGRRTGGKKGEKKKKMHTDFQLSASTYMQIAYETKELTLWIIPDGFAASTACTFSGQRQSAK